MDFKIYYRRFGIYTIIAVYFLILVGGLVRASGSGMGCPDWPKCFQRWIPPTSISELPANYRDLYSENGVVVEEFNAIKTWTEYINRLIGVIIGLLVFVTFILSFGFYKSDLRIFLGSLLSFLLVGFQGWLGAKVVSSNLSPYKITIHMIMALLIVCILIYCIVRAQKDILKIKSQFTSNRIYFLGLIVLLLSLIQLVLGTQVRQQVDFLAHQGTIERVSWIDSLGTIFLVHRSFSIILLILNIYLYFNLKVIFSNNKIPMFMSNCVLLCIAAEILVGVGLNYLDFPVYLQPLHLLFGSGLIGFQFVVLLIIKQNTHTNRPILV